MWFLSFGSSCLGRSNRLHRKYWDMRPEDFKS